MANIGSRFVKFSLVGVSGIIVNELITGISLVILTDFSSVVIRANVSVFFGWFTSVLTNFLLNYYWTWKDRKAQDSTPLIHKLGKYYISAAAAFVVQLSVVTLLAIAFGWSPANILLFNLAGILLGTVVNFALADKWVFGASPYNHTLLAFLFILLVTVFKLVFIQEIGLVHDEAYYWDWSRRLSWGYFDHPPMVAFFIALTTKLLGNAPFVIRLPAILGIAGTSLVMYDLGRKLFDSKTSLIAMIISNSTLICFVGSLVMTPDIPQVFFWTLTVNLFWRALRGHNLLLWIMTGLCIGLGLQSKYTFILIIPSFFLFLILSKSERDWIRNFEPYLMVIVALLVFLPVVIWNYQHNWISFLFQLQHGLGTEKTISLRWMDDFWIGQAIVTSPILFIGFLAALWYGVKQGVTSNNTKFLYLFSLSAPIFFFFLLSSLRSKVDINWPIPAYISGILLLTAVYYKEWHLSKRIRIWAKIGVALSVMLVVLALIEVYLPFLPIKPSRNPVSSARGWEQLAERVDFFRTESKNTLTIVTDRYQYSALLAFYLPGQPETYCLAPQRRFNQYELWGNYNKLLGKDVLYVTKKKELSGEIERLFRDVVKLEELHITWDESVIRTVSIYLCRGFRGYTASDISKYD